MRLIKERLQKVKRIKKEKRLLEAFAPKKTPPGQITPGPDSFSIQTRATSEIDKLHQELR